MKSNKHNRLFSSICIQETSLIIWQLLESCSAKILSPLGLCHNEADILSLFPINQLLASMPKTKPNPEMDFVTLTSVFYCGPRVTAMTITGKSPLLLVGCWWGSSQAIQRASSSRSVLWHIWRLLVFPRKELHKEVFKVWLIFNLYTTCWFFFFLWRKG